MNPPICHDLLQRLLAKSPVILATQQCFHDQAVQNGSTSTGAGHHGGVPKSVENLCHSLCHGRVTFPCTQSTPDVLNSDATLTTCLGLLRSSQNRQDAFKGWVFALVKLMQVGHAHAVLQASCVPTLGLQSQPSAINHLA